MLPILLGLLRDLITLLRLAMLPRAALLTRTLTAEKQSAMFLERGLKPRRATTAEKLAFVLLARFHNWRESLVVVRPATFTKWMRECTLRRWRELSRKKQPGRPRIPNALRAVVRGIAAENPIWTARRIAKELLLKLGLDVAPNTVRRYMPPRPSRTGTDGDQLWRTFIKNHASVMVACDFATVYAPSLFHAARVFYVFVAIEIGSRKIVHTHVTAHPTALWTTQQLREALSGDTGHRFLIHDNDSIFSDLVDGSARALGVKPIRTPYRAPRANAFCERAIGTLRRECLDWIIPLGRRHLHSIIREWVAHYNRARPHSSLGPGIPEPPEGLPVPRQPHRHHLPDGYRVVSTPVLGGLHHE